MVLGYMPGEFRRSPEHGLQVYCNDDWRPATEYEVHFHHQISESEAYLEISEAKRNESRDRLSSIIDELKEVERTYASMLEEN